MSESCKQRAIRKMEERIKVDLGEVSEEIKNLENYILLENQFGY